MIQPKYSCGGLISPGFRVSQYNNTGVHEISMVWLCSIQRLTELTVIHCFVVFVVVSVVVIVIVVVVVVVLISVVVVVAAAAAAVFPVIVIIVLVVVAAAVNRCCTHAHNHTWVFADMVRDSVFPTPGFLKED